MVGLTWVGPRDKDLNNVYGQGQGGIKPTQQEKRGLAVVLSLQVEVTGQRAAPSRPHEFGSLHSPAPGIAVL